MYVVGVCESMHMGYGMHVHVSKSKDNLWDLVLSYHTDIRDQTQKHYAVCFCELVNGTVCRY